MRSSTRTTSRSEGTLRQRLSGRVSGEHGFTLIELLVVLAILALLAGVVAPRVLGYFGRAKTDTAALQLETLSAALDMFRLDVGRYPTAQEGVGALVAAPGGAPGWRGPYIKGAGMPLDPWGRPYRYRSPGGNGRPYDLFTLGADDSPGGDGEKRDVYAR